MSEIAYTSTKLNNDRFNKPSCDSIDCVQDGSMTVTNITQQNTYRNDTFFFLIQVLLFEM